ncbi:hypothetical protein [Mesorhizobium sp. SP-1A]|uniref:hypothetical protein n=1 Tax=Mesorhizobium sp. SP-1A TaxID=3077840 RepID=UPI0028F74757|nr:hypothetical protein [Mesorhizobium sp. SP-1A]
MITSLWNKLFVKKAVPDVINEDVAVEGASLFSGVSIITKPEDAPTFKRQYKAVICGDIDLRIEIEDGNYSWQPDRTVSGVLHQSGRGYVFFDPQNIAEKVIIPEIVSATRAFLRHVLELDAEYMNSNDRFVDKKGRTWVLLKDGE